MLIKDDNSISSSNKLDNIIVDEKSTAKDVLSQIINESLKDNTSPLPTQFTTNNFYKIVCGKWFILFSIISILNYHILVFRKMRLNRQPQS